MLDTLLAVTGTLPNELLGLDPACLRLFLDEFGLAALVAPASQGGVPHPPVDDLDALPTAARIRREQEVHYRTLARALPDVAVFLFDHDLRFLVAEGAALEAQGYQREALEGRTLGEVLPPARVAALEPHYRTVLAGEDLAFINDRGDRVYQVRGRPIRDESGAVIAGLLVSQDVTVRQQAERALQTSEARYRALLDALPAVVTVLDRDGIYRFTGGRGLAAIGRTPDAVLGRSIFEVRRDRPDILDDVRRALAGEAVHATREVNGIAWETRYAPLHDDAGALDGTLYAAIDTTARTRAEAALQASEARFRTILGSLREGVVLQDAQGRIVEANRAAERLLGLTTDQLRGLTSLDPRWHAVHEDGTFWPGEEHPARIVLRTGVAQRDVVMGVYVPDGALIWLLVSAEPLFDDRSAQPSGVVASFIDITARKRTEDALRASEERFRSAFAYAAIGKALVGLDGRLLRVNRALCALLDYDEAELLATDFQTLTHPDDLNLDLAQIRALLVGTFPSYQLEKRYRRRDGRFVWGLLSVSLVRDDEGAPLYFIGQVQDIDARKQAEEALRASEARLAHMAMHDALTGLPNRRRLSEALGQALARLRRGGAPVALLCLDLDGFKTVNDTLGHEAGDLLLVAVADRLRGAVRDGDTPARLGGDELAVLLEGVGADVAGLVAARLVSSLAMPVRIGPTSTMVTASVGGAIATPSDTADDLLRRADQALYAAKHGGKNRHVIATE